MTDPNTDAKPAAKPAEAGATYEAAILHLAAQHGPGKSFTPTDVAQQLAENWRPLLNHIRAAARRLAEKGQIEILRHGKPIEPSAIKGVIRLRLKDAPAEAEQPETDQTDPDSR
ncbi:MAG TPA: DUF3253 domain-containing protein [Acidisoma sp.]|uniref:DUF3253 domain-containing protein n=1 Tax=Acidisoma sp. TaxID=1872115 RepID=UPI002C687FD8|nr:DUF3253 domain-containing protein [Acidisoma sp.]HTI01383.1 DUF3253 domain-containing protein [Acidisoma sp.]